MKIMLVSSLIFILAILVVMFCLKFKRKHNMFSNSKIDEKRYELQNVSFDESMNCFYINYIEHHDKNKIIKYSQKNYKKEPVYSSVETISKKMIQKICNTIKNFEEMPFSKNIIIKLYKEEIVWRCLPYICEIPSWFESEIYDIEEKIKTKNYNNSNVKKILNDYNSFNIIINELTELISTLKWYNIFKKRRLKKQLYQNFEDIKKIEKKINSFSKEERLLQMKIDNYEKYNSIFIKTKNTKKFIFKDKNEMFLYDFFNNIKSKKDIYGCYVIKNLVNNKVYVGQSKNVIKRLNQHFDKNTMIPKNSIFSEDYYTLECNDKKRMFSVTIFRCNTKDELDVKERELITKYDSFKNGYNKTSGNI